MPGACGKAGAAPRARAPPLRRLVPRIALKAEERTRVTSPRNILHQGRFVTGLQTGREISYGCFSRGLLRYGLNGMKSSLRLWLSRFLGWLGWFFLTEKLVQGVLYGLGFFFFSFFKLASNQIPNV